MKLKYFLDHPQIKRHKSPGNGNAPGSLAEKINFGGKNNPKTQPVAKPQSTPKPDVPKASSATGRAFESIRKAFSGK